MPYFHTYRRNRRTFITHRLLIRFEIRLAPLLRLHCFYTREHVEKPRD